MLKISHIKIWDDLLSTVGLVKQDTIDKDILAIEGQLVKIQTDLSLFKQFFNEAYYYAGSYPNYKAQADFRQLLELLESPMFATSAQPKVEGYKITLDMYLSRLSKAADVILGSSSSATDRAKEAHEDCRRVTHKAAIEGEALSIKRPETELDLLLKLNGNSLQLPDCATKEDYLSAAFVSMGVDPDKLVAFMQSDEDAALKDMLFRCISFNVQHAQGLGIYNTKPWLNFFERIKAA
jgi:hypothetical protein